MSPAPFQISDTSKGRSTPPKHGSDPTSHRHMFVDPLGNGSGKLIRRAVPMALASHRTKARPSSGMYQCATSGRRGLELPHDPLAVRRHHSTTELEHLDNLPVRVALDHEPKDLLLPGRKAWCGGILKTEARLLGQRFAEGSYPNLRRSTTRASRSSGKMSGVRTWISTTSRVLRTTEEAEKAGS